MAKIRLQVLVILVLCSLFATSSASVDPETRRNPCYVETGLDSCYLDRNSQVCFTDRIYRDIVIPNRCHRSNIFSQGGFVVAYPSAGGVVFMVRPTAVDLQHLGLPYTYDTERSVDIDSSVEDDLADRMLQLGGQWWPDWATYMTHRSRLEGYVRYDDHYPPEVQVAYPSTGGLWVAKFSQDIDQINEYSERPPFMPYRSDRWDLRMEYILTMGDKCDAMEKMGAVFYENIADCPDVPKTAAEAKEKFKPFEGLLQKMIDESYREGWHQDCYAVHESERVKTSWTWWKRFDWGLWTPWR